MRPWFSASLATGAALAVSTFAHASSAPTGSITIEGLARVEGTLGYCADIDWKSSSKYHQALENILTGHSEKEIKDDQKSSRYAFALGALYQEIIKIPIGTATSSCKSFIGTK